MTDLEKIELALRRVADGIVAQKEWDWDIRDILYKIISELKDLTREP